MHPDLLNNSLFLKYYRQWQDDPTSIVFAPIAEYMLTYGLIEEAFQICHEGLKRHPNLISGHLVMSKVYIKKGKWEEAETEAKKVLAIIPENQTAKKLVNDATESRSITHRDFTEEDKTTSFSSPQARHVDELTSKFAMPSWNTVTMANIYAAQGHYEQARNIYQSILNRDPDNEAARRGLDSLLSVAG